MGLSIDNLIGWHQREEILQRLRFLFLVVFTCHSLEQLALALVQTMEHRTASAEAAFPDLQNLSPGS